MVGERVEAMVLGIGNVLWADEGFGVRAVEALHAGYAFPASVALHDGGTQGLYLYGLVAGARRVLVLDAVDFGLPPGTLAVRRGDDVPAWSAAKMSPHQTGFGDILALAKLRGEAPEAVTLVGVQPEELGDLGGSLRPAVRARLDDAVAAALSELASWGLPGVPRGAASVVEPLNAGALELRRYESQRPSADDACRHGDARVLVRTSREGA